MALISNAYHWEFWNMFKESSVSFDTAEKNFHNSLFSQS